MDTEKESVYVFDYMLERVAILLILNSNLHKYLEHYFLFLISWGHYRISHICNRRHWF